ncbi:MAG: DEAD/DEAH box helicase [Bacilli bacterium]
MTFKSFNLTSKMVESLNKLGVNEPTQIQKEIIPVALKSKNVVGISNTGSGKTYAFLVPLLEKINVSNNRLQAVIISPTRELAMQLYSVCEELAKIYNSDIKVKKFIGGTSKNDNNSNCHIAIGTPGRIHDLFIQESSLRVDLAHTFVIDEADMVFEDNYLESIDEIKSRISINDVQYMVFSATISKNLSSFLKKYLTDTKVIDCSGVKGISDNVEHILIKSKFDQKDDKLLQLLKTFNPYTCLIFASHKTDVERLYYFLNENGYKVGMLHGDMQPRQRKRVIKEMMDDKYQYLVASDIASRGIDLTMVTHVISYDLPNELVFYSHRSGRCGRFDATGISYLLYDVNDLESINKIQSTGIIFKEYNVIKGELVEKKMRNFSKNNGKVNVVITKKEKKVKPGYKKKQQEKYLQAKKAMNKKSRRKKR